MARVFFTTAVLLVSWKNQKRMDTKHVRSWHETALVSPQACDISMYP